MNTALKRLKEKIAQTRVPEEVPKLTKGAFVSFGTERDRGVAPILPAASGMGPPHLEPEIDRAEREAIAIQLGGVPEIYAPAFAGLQAHAPSEVPLERWHQFVNDSGIFLDHWGREAERLGWRAEELFGLHPDAPTARYDRMGLLWILKGQRVVALTASKAKLSGALTLYRK